MVFSKSEESMKNMFMRERMARSKYSSKIRNNEETSNDFYEPEN
jgi:hypothetical protein